jgi:hypothetical protein
LFLLGPYIFRRKWLALNNASRQQMGFNSGFKGLNTLLVVETA